MTFTLEQAPKLGKKQAAKAQARHQVREHHHNFLIGV